MADLVWLEEGLAAREQVELAEVAGLAGQGFRALICNRPDGEGPGQPAFAAIEAEAARHGMKAAHVPVVPGQAGPAEVKAMAEALASLPRPILAYCRSGARSQGLWRAARAV